MDYEVQQEINENLRFAAQEGAFDKVMELLDQGGDINAFDETGRTTLHYAVESNESRLVHTLIEKGAEVNAQDEEMANDTALAMAAEQGALKIVKMLLRAGADPYITGVMGNDALHRAEQCESADAEKIKDAIIRTKPPKKNRRMR